MFRTLRAVFSTSRLPLKLQAGHSRSPSSSAYHIQRVRFVQPLLSKRRLLNGALYGTALICGIVVLPAVALTLFEDEDEDEDEAEDEGLPAKEDSDSTTNDEVDEESIFIPLGLTRVVQSKPYKSSDPEWQEFVKFSRDKTNHKRIRDELKSIVAQSVAKNPPLNRLIGSPFKIRQAWLELQFPNRPPPVRYTSGLEITDSYFAWTSRQITYAEHRRRLKIFFPESISFSFLAAFHVLFSKQIEMVKKRWGIEPATPHAHSKSMVPSKGTTQEGSNQGRPQENQNAASARSQTDQSSQEPNSSRPSPQLTPARLESQGTKNGVQLPNPPLPKASESVSGAIGAFKMTLAKLWQPGLGVMYVNRGEFFVTGLIEFEGPRACATVDIQAAYDPKARHYSIIAAKIRTIREKSQKAKG